MLFRENNTRESRRYYFDHYMAAFAYIGATCFGPVF